MHYTNEEILQTCLFHKDKFFEEQNFKQQVGQKIVSDAIIRNVLFGTGKEIIHEVSRQAGKTEIIVKTSMFILLYIQEYWKMLGKFNRGKFEMGIFAPQREQSKTAFDRLKEGLELIKSKYGFSYDEANGNTLKIIVEPYTSIVYTFALTATSQIESKSMDFAIFDEAQKINDKEMHLKAFPMLASTNGVRVYTGTSGYNLCYFYNLQNRLDDTVEKYIYDVNEIIKQKKEMYERTGIKEFLNYEKYFNEEVKKHGITSDYIRSQFLLEWILERGMFVTPDKLEKAIQNIETIKTDMENDVCVGIDCAKDSDSTVAVAWRWENYKRDNWEHAKKCIRVLSWFVINKELYSDQWEILEENFLKNYNVYKINIDGTGSGDGTGDWFLKKYDNVDYDKFKQREANNKRGMVRPIKFSSSSKNIMYKAFQKYIEEEIILIPNDPDSVGFNKFIEESKTLLKEYKGDLLSVHHSDIAGATDDCWDALAMTFFDIDSVPIKRNTVSVAVYKKANDFLPQRKITESWLTKQIRKKNKKYYL